MKKISVISLILFLILFTAIVKNSTKRVDDMIFISEENIRSLKKDFENLKLENEYLSSSEKLLEYQNMYFDEELVKKELEEIKVIKKVFKKIEIEQLSFSNE